MTTPLATGGKERDDFSKMFIDPLSRLPVSVSEGGRPEPVFRGRVYSFRGVEGLLEQPTAMGVCHLVSGGVLRRVIVVIDLRTVRVGSKVWNNSYIYIFSFLPSY